MLLDTSGLLCCFDADERRHANAISHYDDASRRITHNYVLAEFIALTDARSLPRKESLEFIEAIESDVQIEVVWVDQAVHAEAMRMLQSQLDKSYSLCDAVSFVLMQRLAIIDALTTDHHFEQAGFRSLLIE